MKYIISLIVSILFAGCGAKHYYMLSSPHQIGAVHEVEKKVIGVESIELPPYITEGKVAVLREDNRVEYLDDALWAVNMQEDLTNALIFDLQKSLPQSQILHYPWEGHQHIDAIVHIKITRFIAYRGFVYLDAVVRINNHDKVVSLKEPTNMKESAQIVESMKKAFFSLERAVIVLLDDIETSHNRGK